MKHGEEFNLKVYVADNQFFVSYNGHHICSFAFRIPTSTITHVEICGMIDLYKIEMEDFQSYPANGDDLHVAEVIHRHHDNSNDKLMVSFACYYLFSLFKIVSLCFFFLCHYYI